MSKDDPLVVTGVGGFIGGHVVRGRLKPRHTNARAIDVKLLDHWYQRSPWVDTQVAELAPLGPGRAAARGARTIGDLRADVGGMGFIEAHKAQYMLSLPISTRMLVAAKKAGTERLCSSSSACVHNGEKQSRADVTALTEGDASPAVPEDGDGRRRCSSERIAHDVREDLGIATSVARSHIVYGPLGTYDGGHEKPPAATCRQVVAAKLPGAHDIEIWGEGEQTGSFMYVAGTIRGPRQVAETPAHTDGWRGELIPAPSGERACPTSCRRSSTCRFSACRPR